MRTMWVVFAVLVSTVVGAIARADDAARVLAEIRTIAAEESANPARFLVRVMETCRAALQTRDADATRLWLATTGWKLDAATETGSGIEYRYVILADARLLGDALPVDVYLAVTEFEHIGGSPADLPIRLSYSPPRIGLRAKGLPSLEEARVATVGSNSPMVREALESWAVAETRESNPVLNAIELSLEERMVEAAGYPPLSFWLQFEFARSREDLAHGAIVECRAALSEAGTATEIDPSRWRRREVVPKSELTSLPEELRAILATDDPSYQRVVQRANRAIERVTRGREWAEIEPVLTGFGWTPRDTRFEYLHEYVVAAGEIRLPTGSSADLIAVFETMRPNSSPRPRSIVVIAVTAGFDADVKEPLDGVIAARSFGNDCAIQQALVRGLEDDDVQRAPKARILDSISLRYGVLRNRWRLQNPRGFSITANLTDGRSDPIDYGRFAIELPSGLERYASYSSEALTRDFVASDTLGEPPGSVRASFIKREIPRSTFVHVLARSDARGPDDGEQDEVSVVEDLAALRALPPTTRRMVVKVESVVGADLAALVAFRDLEFLDLGACSALDDASLTQLRGLDVLEELCLSGEAITGVGFASLRDLPALTTLRLRTAERLTDEGVGVLGECRHLRTLGLRWCKSLTDLQLEGLGALENLRELSILECDKIADDGLASLATLPNLERLSFSHAPNVGPEGIASLAAIRGLKDLTIGFVPLPDPMLASLARIESLESLTLNGIEFPEEGLLALAAMHRLKRLEIGYGKNVSAGSIAALKAALGDEFRLTTR